MSDNETKVLQLLSDKRDMIVQMLYLSDSTKYRGNEDDAAKYVDLMEKRQGYYDNIVNIDDTLAELGADGLLLNGSKDFIKEATLIDNNAKAAAYKIIELDNANRENVSSIMEKLKGGFKVVNEGKSIRNLYSDDLSPYNGYYFDKKK